MRGSKLSGLFALGAFAMVGGMGATDPAFAKIDVDKLTIGGEARIKIEDAPEFGFAGTVRIVPGPDYGNQAEGLARFGRVVFSSKT